MNRLVPHYSISVKQFGVSIVFLFWLTTSCAFADHEIHGRSSYPNMLIKNGLDHIGKLDVSCVKIAKRAKANCTTFRRSIRISMVHLNRQKHLSDICA